MRSCRGVCVRDGGRAERGRRTRKGQERRRILSCGRGVHAVSLLVELIAAKEGL